MWPPGGSLSSAPVERALERHRRDGEFCALGQGTLAIRPILDALSSIEYSQWLIVDEETKTMSTEETFRIASDCLQAEGLPLTQRSLEV
jgi:sugar phosphate isomerase/epimerase